MATANSPCAACKFLRRKCTPECIFAPHFPPDQPEKFSNVHKVFGASNVQKILAELPVEHREDAVNSLCYEAESRRRDPVYGCIALISFLQQRVQNLQGALHDAHKELASYQDLVLQSQQAMGPSFPANQMTPAMMNHLMMHPSASMMGIPTGGSSLMREPGPQGNNPNNAFNPEQLNAATATVVTDQQQQQLMIRALELQKRNQNIRFDGGQVFDIGVGSSSGVGALGIPTNEPPHPLQVSPPNMLGGLESGLTHLHIQHQLSMQPQQVMAVEEHQVQEQESQGENGYGEAETGPGAASH